MNFWRNTMPIYEFLCEKCDQTIEIMQKINEPAPEECERCHARQSLKKVVSSTSFHLKGGGWYKDAYSSKKPSNESAVKTCSNEGGCQSK